MSAYKLIVFIMLLMFCINPACATDIDNNATVDKYREVITYENPVCVTEPDNSTLSDDANNNPYYNCGDDLLKYKDVIYKTNYKDVNIEYWYRCFCDGEGFYEYCFNTTMDNVNGLREITTAAVPVLSNAVLEDVRQYHIPEKDLRISQDEKEKIENRLAALSFSIKKINHKIRVNEFSTYKLTKKYRVHKKDLEFYTINLNPKLRPKTKTLCENNIKAMKDLIEIDNETYKKKVTNRKEYLNSLNELENEKIELENEKTYAYNIFSREEITAAVGTTIACVVAIIHISTYTNAFYYNFNQGTATDKEMENYALFCGKMSSEALNYSY